MSENNQRPALASPGTKVSEPGPARRKRILLAEGDGFTRLVLLFLLRVVGFQVDFTSNGMLAMGKLRNCHPDALLIELKLRGVSGLELIKAARADPAFGARPICVFTYADQMSRATRKEVQMLATTLFDKASISREHVVQTFATLLWDSELASEQAAAGEQPSTSEQPPASTAAELPAEALEEMALPSGIEEIVAGVRDQCKVLAHCSDAKDRAAGGGELLSRVRSLASCADAAGLPDLFRQSHALEHFLNQLSKHKQAYSDAVVSTVTRAVQVMDLLVQRPTDQKQYLSQFTAVIVDEAPASNQAITESLVNAGFSPMSFQEAARGNEYLASNWANLIIVNMLLPEAHGLALADIRALALHAATPVIFVPESSVLDHSNEQLATSAPQLNTNALLLTELIMKALNEVQSTDTSRAASTASPAPASAVEPLATSHEEAIPPTSDYFELFAGPKRPEAEVFIQPSAQPPAFAAQESSWPMPVRAAATAPPVSLAADDATEPNTANTNLFTMHPHNPSPQSASAPADPTQEPVAWANGQAIQDPVAQPAPALANSLEPSDAVFAAASLPSQPVLPAQPGTTTGECAAEAVPGLPATSIDEGQSADQRLQMAQPLAWQAEAPELPKPELIPEDKTAAAERLAAADSDTSKPVAPMNTDSQPEQNEAASARVRPATAPGQEQGAKGKFQAAQAEPLESYHRASQAPAFPAASEQQDAATSDGPLEQLAGQSQPQRVDGAGQIAELEQQVRQSVAALTRATADLAKERGERQRSEQRTAALTARLQQLHEELSSTVQAHREDLERIRALEEQLLQAEQGLSRRTADFEQQQAERRLAEEQLRKARELNAQFRKNLSFLEEANKSFDRVRQELEARLEASLNASREMEARYQREAADRQQRAQALDGIERDLQARSRKCETFEKELQTTLAALQESEAKWKQEAAERQRLQQALESAQLTLRDRSDGRDLELCKLESALQIEQAQRKRQERQLTRARQASVDSLRATRALRNSLRRQIREPVDNLYNSALGLLQLELGEQQKKLAEAVLQDVLLVHTRLREPELPSGDAAEAQPPTTTSV